jgi:hypothetical protein
MTGMKKDLSNFLLIIITVLAFGCDIQSQDQVDGNYARVYLGVKDSIILNKDGTFNQVITATNGASWSLNGSWKIIHRVIQLDKCYLSFDDEKQRIIIPPETVYACIFSFSGKNLMRTELQPIWIKN